MLAQHFSRFFEANKGGLHFGAHSHHPWPDATQAAQWKYWVDSATQADKKWEHVFGAVIPAAQAHVARLLKLPDSKLVAFAPNSHEFVKRLFSCLDPLKPARVLTTSNEFHSFRRQFRRLEEAGRIKVTEESVEPYESFVTRFATATRSDDWDLIWLSHVFFDSGFVVPDLLRLVEAAPRKAIVAVDGYHAFCALPVDLTKIHKRAFYLAGGYKYAMSGEGAAFMAIPPGCTLRPVDTGWFASFDTLDLSHDPKGASPQDPKVAYSNDAFRFWGSTFDPSGLYRFNAAMDWLQQTGTGIDKVHAHARELQKRFLDGLAKLKLVNLAPRHLIPPAAVQRGNFLTFDIEDAKAVHERILAAGLYIDRRGRRLRFGFGVYHDAAAVDKALKALKAALK